MGYYDVLEVLKNNPKQAFNKHNISKILGISHVNAWKHLKSIERREKHILIEFIRIQLHSSKGFAYIKSLRYLEETNDTRNKTKGSSTE